MSCEPEDPQSQCETSSWQLLLGFNVAHVTARKKLLLASSVGLVLTICPEGIQEPLSCSYLLGMFNNWQYLRSLLYFFPNKNKANLPSFGFRTIIQSSLDISFPSFWLSSKHVCVFCFCFPSGGELPFWNFSDLYEFSPTQVMQR